jgi:hypothetical protein
MLLQVTPICFNDLEHKQVYTGFCYLTNVTRLFAHYFLFVMMGAEEAVGKGSQEKKSFVRWRLPHPTLFLQKASYPKTPLNVPHLIKNSFDIHGARHIDW